MAEALSAGERAARRLLAEADAMAIWLTDRLYAERPYLLEKYGERGRRHTLQDMKHNVEHLAPAVALDEPQMFAAYVQWLDELLRARNVATTEVIRTLELMELHVRERLAGDEADAAAACIAAGLRAVGVEAS